MMMNELISVIIPVYNVIDYLPHCVDSVLKQSYANLEIILVDDGSTDGSSGLCDRLAGTDNRIRVIHQVNSGVSCARNAGIKACTGQMIGFVDSDDRCEPEMYEKLLQSMLQNNSDVVMCGFYNYPRGPEEPEERGITPVQPCGFEEAAYHVLKRHEYFTSVWNKLFRREAVFKDNGIILMNPEFSFGEDEAWLLEVLHGCERFSFVPQPLYHWNPRIGSITRYPEITPKQMSIFASKKHGMSFLPQTKEMLTMAKGVIYNDSFFLLVQSYVIKDHEYRGRIRAELAPMKSSWLRSSNIPFLRKLKVICLRAEMALRLPAGFVWWTDRLKRS